MKVWLDDERPAPDGWLHARTAPEALALIRGGVVTEASLDHDLGDEPWTGYWLLRSIEHDAGRGLEYALPAFTVHSANPVGRKNMMAAIASIERLANLQLSLGVETLHGDKCPRCHSTDSALMPNLASFCRSCGHRWL